MQVFVSAIISVLACVGQATADDNAPTFNRDMAPILFEHCAVCHRPNDIGPFPLLTYQDAKKRAKQLARISDKRIMPPWMPNHEWAEFKDARAHG